MPKMERNGPAPERLRVQVWTNRNRDPEMVEWLWQNPRHAAGKIRELLRAYLVSEGIAAGPAPGRDVRSGPAEHPRHEQAASSVTPTAKPAVAPPPVPTPVPVPPAHPVRTPSPPVTPAVAGSPPHMAEVGPTPRPEVVDKMASSERSPTRPVAKQDGARRVDAQPAAPLNRETQHRRPVETPPPDAATAAPSQAGKGTQVHMTPEALKSLESLRTLVASAPVPRRN